MLLKVFGKQCLLPSGLQSGVHPLYNFDHYPNEMKYRIQRAQEDKKNNLFHNIYNRKLVYDKNSESITYKKGDLIIISKQIRDKLDKGCDGPFELVEDILPNFNIVKNNT